MGEADGSIVIDTGLSNEGFDRGSKELLAAIRELSAAVVALGQKISTSFSNITASFGGVARGGTNAAKEVGNLEKEIDNFVGKTEGLGDRTGTVFKSADDVLKFNQNIQAAEAQLERLREKFEEADAAPKISENTAALEKELQSAEAELDKMRDKVSSLREQGYTQEQVLNYDPDIFTNMQAQAARVAELRQQVDQAQAQDAERMAEPFNAMEEQLRRAEEQISLAKQGIDQEALAQAQLNVQIAQEAVLQAENERERQKALEQLERAQADLRAIAGDMTGQVAPAAEEASKKVEKIGHSSREAHKHANILVKTLTSLKRMLITRVKRMFIAAIFNSIKEGIKGLALFSSSFDKAISDMKNRAKELAYNIVATFGPIAQAIMPAISRIVDAVSKAMTYVNALISKLSGKSTMIVAKKQTKSYADSLRGAAAEAKALNAQVYGFDELNKRSSNSGSSSGSDSGAGDLANMFEEVDIDSAVPTRILDFINELKDAVSSGNWVRFGETLAEGVNGLVGSLGKLDFSPVVKGVNNAIDAAKGFTGALDWAGMGRDAGAFVNNLVNAFRNINWAGIGQTISNGIKGVLSTASNFLEEIDWMNIGDSLMQALSDVITNIDWVGLIGELGRFLWDLISGAFQLAFGLLSGLSGMLGDIFKALGLDGIAEFFYGIEDGLKNIGTWLKENVFDPVVNWFKNLFGINSPSTVFQGFGTDLIAGLLNGIKQTWSSITSFFSGVFNGIKNFVSNTWSNIKAKTSEVWGGIKSTLSNTWNNLKTTVSTTWENIKTKVSTTWENIKAGATQKWTEIKTSLSAKWESLKTTASTTWENIKTKASTAWDNIKSTASSKWQNIKTTISEKWNGLKTTLSTTSWTDIGTNLVTGLKNGISNTWSTITTTATSLASGLTTSLKKLFGIASPSKVWENVIGANLTAGLSEGIELGSKDVLRTTDRLAKEINGSMDGVSLWHGSADIAARSFKTPQIAAGTVIPARTRISALNSSDALYGANKALLGGVDEQLDDQTYVLRQILEALKKVDLTIDADALTRIISKKQRAHELNYGGM